MRRHVLAGLAGGAILFHGDMAGAQSTLEALQQELNDAKTAHLQVTAQVLSNFFAQIDPAMASPDAAVELYEQAGGTLPDPSPVITENVNETATEKATRLALDQGNLVRVGTVVQLQCGMMHYGALFVVKPDQAGLQDQWATWLKSAARVYPQLSVPGNSPPAPEPHKKKDKNGQGAPPAKPAPPQPYNPADLKSKPLKDTIITKYLAFAAWGDKEQGLWTVKDLPKLYRANVLEPLRVTPTPTTLAAWDAYIGMLNADEKDNDKWNQVVYPPLQFDRACDDYSVSPSTEKLEGLVNMIKANPTNPHADDWIARVAQLMDDYRSRHGGKPVAAQDSAPAPAAPTTDPNVTVTTQQEGDATIITTHTNAAPVAPTH